MADPAPLPPPIVVKVGGSLAEAGRLKAVLAIIAKATVPLVLVPGGGPFADVVREQYQKLGLTMPVAHRMAMLGMHQMAEVIAAHDACFEITDTLEGIRDSARNGDIPIWVPLRMIGDDTEIPADWTATSDTVAARLAELLGQAPLILVKSVSRPGDANANALAEARVVDSFFPRIVERSGLSWRIFGPADDLALSSALAGDEMRAA